MRRSKRRSSACVGCEHNARRLTGSRAFAGDDSCGCHAPRRRGIQRRSRVLSRSNCQTATSPHSRGSILPEHLTFPFDLRSEQKRGARLGSQERERSAARRNFVVAAPLRGRDRSEDRSRPTALHCGVFLILGAPLPFSPDFAVASGGDKERALCAVVREEAGPRSPGSTVCETMRAGTAPHPRSVSPRNAPRRMGMCPPYGCDPTLSRRKFKTGDGSLRC